MRHPGTKQHTNNVIHVVHTATTARMTTTMMMMTIEAAMAWPGSTFGLTVVVDMTVASHRHGEPADSVSLRERSNSQLRDTRFVQEVWLFGVLLKQSLRQLCDWDLHFSPDPGHKVCFVV